MVTLYSTGCPRCTVLEKKMEQLGVLYEKNTNVDEMQALGMTQVPMLCVDGKMYDFVKANNWLNNMVGGNT